MNFYFSPKTNSNKARVVTYGRKAIDWLNCKIYIFDCTKNSLLSNNWNIGWFKVRYDKISTDEKLQVNNFAGNLSANACKQSEISNVSDRGVNQPSRSFTISSAI